MLTDAEAGLVWVPMDATTLRLAWDVTLTSRVRGEMYRVLVDAETAAVLVRQSLTAYNAGHDTGNREYAEKVMAAAERWRTE